MEGVSKFISGEEPEKAEELLTSEEARLARLAEGDEMAYEMSERERMREPEALKSESLKMEVKETKEIKESKFSPDQLLTIYRLLEGKGSGVAEAPPDFKAPEEIKENAERFFEARERYLEEFEKHYQASEKLKKAGASEEADAEFQQAQWYLENATKNYNLVLEAFKKDIIGYKYRAKLKEFPEIVKLDKKMEYAKAGASVMSGITHFVINDFEREKIERLEKGKERGVLGKLWQKYKNLDQGTRLGISAGLSGVIGAGLALAAGPGGWFVLAGVAGHRSLRTLGGGVLAAGLRSLGEKIIGPRFGKKKTQALIEEAANLEKGLLNEIEKQRKLSRSEKKKIENKLWMSILVDKQAESYGQKLREIARKEGKTKFWLTLGSGLIGGLTAAGLDWYFSRPKISEVAELVGTKKGAALIEPTGKVSTGEVPTGSIKTGVVEVIPGKAGVTAGIMEKLPIGKRGPEGAMIDYFKSNPEAAKKFGWDGIKDLKDWSGIKAHQLWFQDAQEALQKPEIISKLKSLGYSQDMEGYGQMMRRIKEGSIILKPDGTMDLAERMDYLKAVKETTKETIEGAQPDINQLTGKVTWEIYKHQDAYEQAMKDWAEKYPDQVFSSEKVWEYAQNHPNESLTAEKIHEILGKIEEVSPATLTEEVTELTNPERLTKLAEEQIIQEQGIISGIKNIFEGKDIDRTLTGIFGTDIFPEGSIPKINIIGIGGGKKMGVIENVFGKKGFRILFTEDKIGVDGPGFYNFGYKGEYLLTYGRPTLDSTPENIGKIKNFISESVKHLASLKETIEGGN